jgi:hypothetical protein
VTEKRAIRDFTTPGALWPAVDEWAGAQGYRLIEPGDGRRLYQKGEGILAGMRLLELRKTGDQVHLEAWVSARLLARIMSAFILPSEITIESGGMKAVLPRKLGRAEVNDLLEALGQPPVE